MSHPLDVPDGWDIPELLRGPGMLLGQQEAEEKELEGQKM